MNDFVVVAVRPQSSVESLLNSTVSDPTRTPFELVDGAEIATLVSRRSFFEDILRKSFPVKTQQSKEAATATVSPPPPPPEQLVDDSLSSFVMVERADCPSLASSSLSPAQHVDAVDISLEHWQRIFKQFQADIHREAFLIAGKQYDDAFVAHAALRTFLAATLGACSANKQPVETARVATLWKWPWSSSTPVPSPHDAMPRDDEGDVDRLCREVILLSQQSVLGFPLEVIQSYVDSAASASTSAFHGAKLYVGEVSKDRGDGSGSSAGTQQSNLMRVEVSSAPRDGENACSAPVLSVNKTLRVFFIDEETLHDATAFYIRATLNVDLLGTLEDPVQLSWTVVDASDKYRGPQSTNSNAATTQSHDEEDEEVHAHGGRRCECLGAASGFHRTGCPFRK